MEPCCWNATGANIFKLFGSWWCAAATWNHVAGMPAAPTTFWCIAATWSHVAGMPLAPTILLENTEKHHLIKTPDRLVPRPKKTWFPVFACKHKKFNYYNSYTTYI